MYQKGDEIHHHRHDKHKLIFFGFTHCPMVCPTALATISIALEEIGSDSDDIYPIFISVDPERDTPERMKEYLADFHKNFQLSYQANNAANFSRIMSLNVAKSVKNNFSK